MNKKITNFSRAFIQTAVAYKIADPTKIRDYDILKDHEKGMSHGQIAIKHGLSRRSIIDIIQRYR